MTCLTPASNLYFQITDGTITAIGTLSTGTGDAVVFTPLPFLGNFDSSGNVEVFDSTTSIWRSLTAPGGVLTVGP